jgi:hypothetical protein
MTLRYLGKYPVVTHLPQTLTSFRLHETSKTSSRQSDFHRVRMIICNKMLKDPYCASHKRICSLRLRSRAYSKRLDAIVRSNGSATSRAFSQRCPARPVLIKMSAAVAIGHE